MCREPHYLNSLPSDPDAFNSLHAVVKAIFFTVCVCLTCPEWSGLPVLVVLGEAGEARHAAGVIVTQALQ